MSLTNEQIELITNLVEELVASTIITRYNIPAGVIQRRHIGEGVKGVRSGLAASIPSEGDSIGDVYFSYDTDTLSIWNGSSWVDEVFT